MRMWRNIIASFIFLLALSSFAYAAPKDATELIAKANSGDAKAQYTLGAWGSTYYGLTCDDNFKWLHLSAEQNFPAAVNALSNWYANGCGANAIHADPKEAYYWRLRSDKLFNLYPNLSTETSDAISTRCSNIKGKESRLQRLKDKLTADQIVEVEARIKDWTPKVNVLSTTEIVEAFLKGPADAIRDPEFQEIEDIGRRDGKKEIILLWREKTPANVRYNLTIFSDQAGELKPRPTIELEGVASFLGIEYGVIFLEITSQQQDGNQPKSRRVAYRLEKDNVIEVQNPTGGFFCGK